MPCQLQDPSAPPCLALLYLSCTAPTAVCGDGAFRMRFLRKRLSVAGVGASQRPAVAGGCCCQLHVHRAPPGNVPHCHPAHAPCHRPCVSQILALSLLVLSLLMTHISSHLDLSLPWLSATLMSVSGSQRSPGSPRGDASPGSKGAPPASTGTGIGAVDQPIRALGSWGLIRINTTISRATASASSRPGLFQCS